MCGTVPCIRNIRNDVGIRCFRGDVEVTRTYDAAGQLTAEHGTATTAEAALTAPDATTSFGFDRSGRLTVFGHPDGGHTVDYNGLGQPTAVTSPDGAGDSSFAYDPAGRLIGRTDRAGTATFDWDGRDLLDAMVDPATGTTLDYTFDPRGMLSKGRVRQRAGTHPHARCGGSTGPGCDLAHGRGPAGVV